MERVRAYVDGMNLYHGLRQRYGRRYHWLDLQALASSLLKPGQQLDLVTYFTARVRDEPAAEQRQTTYIEALNAHCKSLCVVDGRYQEKQMRCRGCRAMWTTYEEKETDVSIAVSLVEDAALDRFDMALLLSADSDLCPAVRSVRRVDARKRVVVAFPPKRNSADLRRHAHASMFIGNDKIRRSQLPAEVTRMDGRRLARPKYWS